MAGKKVIFVPISMGITLTEGWARRMREHAAMHGYSFEIRDAAFNTGRDVGAARQGDQR